MHGLPASFPSLFSHPFLVQDFNFAHFPERRTQNQLNSASLFPGKNETVSLSCCCCYFSDGAATDADDCRMLRFLPSFLPPSHCKTRRKIVPTRGDFYAIARQSGLKLTAVSLSLSLSVTSLPTSSPSSSSTEFVSHCFQGRVRARPRPIACFALPQSCNCVADPCIYGRMKKRLIVFKTK